tara:strand:- start:993 stop:1565 length:573 start_codon:yes stop_codon:yes gene_type:complete
MTNNTNNTNNTYAANQPLFIKQLLALAETMDGADIESFDMRLYYKPDICGYSACICGEQAVSGRLEHFPLAAQTIIGHGEAANDFSLKLIASDIASDLDISILKSFFKIAAGRGSLAASIIGPDTAIRFRSIKLTNLLTEEQLKHPHLTTISSPALSADYIRMLINVLVALPKEHKRNARAIGHKLGDRL